MSGDYSRQTFDPQKDFSGVLMQQGRVQLDADWNELVDLLDRRWRAETTDLLGRGTVPKETPDGFRIQIAGGKLTIGRGRIYVDGLLAENHGLAPLEFDPVLAELRGTAAVPYEQQPYLPNPAGAPSPKEGGPHLVYLDVWQREVTSLENAGLIEKAVGVDTTTRRQTVWQVKVLPNVGAGTACDTTLPAWEALTAPSAGRLSTEAVGVATSDDPCLIPPSGGYRGLENRLYRVEIHDGGPQGTATFKWSRDNASVATSVTALAALDQLAVARVGRDSVLRFSDGDWVEIVDDWLELAADPQPGIIRQIKKVDDATQTITLTQPLPAGTFPTDAQGKTNPARHTRLRRWDQHGEVRDTNHNLLVDLDAPGSSGLIPVPATGTAIILEDGVQVTFDTPAGGGYRVGDYWTFAARTADASVEPLNHAPPRGLHHHYCRLALVTFPNDPQDCRHFWPPDFGDGGCECSACVTAESHNGGTFTMQAAIDQVKAVGGTVCLGPGVFNLGDRPILITGAQSLKVRGRGWKTILTYLGTGPALTIQNSLGVVIEELTLLAAAAADDPSPAVAVRNCAGVTLQRNYLLRLGSAAKQRIPSPAVGLSGVLVGTHLRENVIFAPVGIGNTPAVVTATSVEVVRHAAPLLTAEFRVEDNDLFCSARGISLDGLSLHTLQTRLSGNLIHDGAQGGIVALGWVAPGCGLDIEGNQIHATGVGITAGIDGARIRNNDISPTQAGDGRDGIVLAPGLDRSGIDRCQVLGNRILGVAGDGISILATVHSAMIKQNQIEGVGGGGIVMDDSSQANVLSIENNQLLNLAPQANDSTTNVVGIRVVQAAQVAVAGNVILGVGRAALQNPSRVGIQVLASPSARIAGNELVDIGPAAEFLGHAAGIECRGTFQRLDVADNGVRRSQTLPADPDKSQWFAVLIRGPRAAMTRSRESFQFLLLETTVFEFLGTRVQALPRGQEIVGVRGNLLEAFGAAPAVFVGDVGVLSLDANRALSVSTEPVADVQADAIVAGSNYLKGRPEAPALVLHLPKGGPLTVLGNITSGPIQIDGATPSPLPTPWAALNVVAP